MLTSRFEPVAEWMINSIRKELDDQGHNLTGKLSNSVARDFIQGKDGFDLDFTHLQYGRYINDGVPAANIPYQRGSGAGSSMYIDALQAWVKARGIATEDKKAKSIAFAIATVQKREGMPTKGSYRYSRNTRRTGFVSFTAMFREQELALRMEVAYSKYYEDELAAMLTKLETEFKDVFTWSQ